MSRKILPGLPDLVFGVVLASVLVGGRHRLLNDPGTSWHLRLGREILQTGHLPRADTLTFTHAGDPWVDQSWLFDLLLALVVDVGGWSLAAALAALAIACVYRSLAASLLLDGRRPLSALTTAILAAGIGSIHFLLRPHLVTLALVLLALRICQRQHEHGGRKVFLTPLITAVWANCHGGFLAGPLIVATAALGHALSGPLDPRRREVSTFALAAFLCIAAGALNPYGFGLYAHVGRLLVSSGVTELIEEYQPIPFGKPDARAFEWVLLALIALPVVSRARLTRYELTQSLAWLHLSLASVRHAPLCALAVAPGLARLIDGLPLAAPNEPNSEPDPDPTPWLWPTLAALALTLAIVTGHPLAAPDPSHWPLATLRTLNQTPDDRPLFHEQDWGGLIEAETLPPRRAYLDDRFELYGKDGILHYLNAIEGGPDWDLIRDRHAIGLVWLRPDRGLARRLADDPGWETIARDRLSVLFRRRVPTELARRAP